MRVISVNVGLPKTIVWKGHPVLSGIFKEPVEGRITALRLNLEGDRQADLSVHGGPEKAIYAYPAEHYDFWRSLLSEIALPPGSFGENLTVEGLTEENVHVGDCFQIGTAQMMVTQPRTPCYKLAAKFGRTDIVRHFLETGYSGFYLAVLSEGEIERGDGVQIIAQSAQRVSIADLNRRKRVLP